MQGEIIRHKDCLPAGQERLPDHLLGDEQLEGRQDLPQEVRGYKALVQYAEGGQQP